jgi:cyclopropane fatty-acyl-phospholipid synthase-like methyltransferase
MTSTLISIVALAAVLLLAVMVIGPALFGSPWHPISRKDLKRALDFCDAQAGERIVDLGSGDGRVLITAAKDYGLVGTGIEIDPIKVWLANLRVRVAGLRDKVKIVRANIFDADYGEADILFIYLTHQAIDKLFPDILEQLKPNTKILCYRFCIQGMTPDKVSADKTLFLYTLNKGTRVNQFR